MKISQLKDGERKVDVIAEIIELGQTRTVNLRAGGTATVCTAYVKDGTGIVELSLWNEQISKVKVGDTVHVKNGYTTSFRGNIQLNIGRYGFLEVMPSQTA